jgi:predicted dehydrogenase
MRRDGAKAEDYAHRHGVKKWYDTASDLITDPDVNAIYVATPPSSHEEYTLAALNAGKPVYVEKPMALNAPSAARMVEAANRANQKLVAAHYRRAQPLFKRIKEIIDNKTIGDILFASIEIYKKRFAKEDLDNPQKAWRVNPALSGGGLFHDLAPHQLDIMYHFFGEPAKASGLASRQGGLYTADDLVMGTINFKSGPLFTGTWAFNVDAFQEKDQCLVMGSNGSIRFSFFDHSPIILKIGDMTEQIPFDQLPHVQQPMIEKVVSYFLDLGPNPCSGEEGVAVMKLLDAFTSY